MKSGRGTISVAEGVGQELQNIIHEVFKADYGLKEGLFHPKLG